MISGDNEIFSQRVIPISAQMQSFPLRIYLVNVIKSGGNCECGHIY